MPPVVSTLVLTPRHDVGAARCDLLVAAWTDVLLRCTQLLHDLPLAITVLLHGTKAAQRDFARFIIILAAVATSHVLTRQVVGYSGAGGQVGAGGLHRI